MKRMETMENNILTPREEEIFDLLILGKSTKDISEFLGITEKTVRNHISNTIQKLSVKNRTDAVIELLKLGLIKLNK